MMEFEDLYQEVIIDHSRQPRNFRALESADRKAEGYNPLCGDRVTIYLKLNNDHIEQATFQGSGCAISTASASLLTEVVTGKSTEEVEALFEDVHHLLKGELEAIQNPERLGKLKALGGVAQYPTRVKCATLAWHTLKAALAGEKEPVSTE